MGQEKVSMGKTKEIPRLRYDLGLRQDQIARSCNIDSASLFGAVRRRRGKLAGTRRVRRDVSGETAVPHAARAGGENRPAPDFVALHR